MLEKKHKKKTKQEKKKTKQAGKEKQNKYKTPLQ